MVDTISELDLPYLPATGYTELQFQTWWQEVAERLTATVSAANDGFREIQAGDERDAAMAAQIVANAAIVRRDLAAIAELFALADMRIAALMAENDAQRRKMAEVETVAWLL